MAPDTIELQVMRYRPEQDEEPTFQTYELEFQERWVVLDAINYIKDRIDGTLSFRWSCRMGVCGSCGMMINGVPKLSCETFVTDYLPGPVRLEPLANYPIERDLVTVMDDFMAKLRSVKPWIIREDEKSLSEGEYHQTSEQLDLYKQFSMCINCTLCYSACPVYAQDPHFLGPAAVALAQRYDLDSRDQGRQEREGVLTGQDGIWECTFVGDCTEVCPAGVDPAGAIQQAKLANTLKWYQDLLIPWGER